MKDFKIIIKPLFLFSLLTLLFIGCEDDEYVAPGDFSDLSITWTTGASTDRVSEVNKFYSLMDLSAGAMSQTWTIPSNAFFLEGPIPNNLENHDAYINHALDSVSTDKTVHVLWKKGDSLTKVKYYAIFKDSTSFRFFKYWDTATNQAVEDTIKTVNINGKWVVDYTFMIDVYDTVVAVPEIRYPDGTVLDHKTTNEITVEYGNKLTFEDLSGLLPDNIGRPNTTRWRLHTIEDDVADQKTILNKTTTRVNLKDKVIEEVTFNKIGEYRMELKVTRERTERLKVNEETYDIPTIIKVVPLNEPFKATGTATELGDDTIEIPVSSKFGTISGPIDINNFSVKVDNVASSIKSISLASTGLKLIVTLNTPLEPEDNGKTVTVSYDGGATNLLSVDERVFEAFSNIAVTVYVPSPITRTGTITKTYADDQLILAFNQTIDVSTVLTSLTPTKGFEVKVNGVVFPMQSVTVDPVDGKLLRLKVVGELYRNDVITVSFTGPSDIRSVGDGRLADFTAAAVITSDDNILGTVGQFENAIGTDWLHTAFTGDGNSYTTTPPTPVTVSSVVPSGNVMRMTGSDGSKPNTITVATFPFEAGVKYRAKFKRYLGTTTTTLFAKHYFGNQSINDNWDKVTDKKGEWQLIEFDFVATATTNGTVRIQPVPLGISDVYYDDFIIQIVDDRP